MAWLRKKSVVEAEPEVVDAAVADTGVIAMPLGVLVPDSGGISSFKLTMHPDPGSAEEQIGALRADVRRGTHAFWAMHERPAPDDTLHVEAIVLIRAKPDADIVYVVSFLDLENALSFTRFELRRGLHIRNVMIYWAAFTQVREELEGVSIIPTTAPPTISEAPLPPGTRLAPPPAPSAPVSVVQTEAATADTAESEARDAVERYLRRNPDDAEATPVARQPAVVEDSLAVAEPPAVAERPAVAEPEIDEEPWPPAKVVRTPRIVPEPHEVEKAAIEEALVLQHPPVAEPVAEPEPDLHPDAAKRQPTEWMPKRPYAVRDKRRNGEQAETAAEPAEAAAEPIAAELIVAEPAVAEPIVSEPGDEEAAWEEAVASGEVVDPAGGFPPPTKYSEFDIALEVEQLLKNRKWETRNGPFSGFKSPPGRF
jgi:hypothetical protein